MYNEKLIEFIEKEYSIIKDFDLSKVIQRGINLKSINDQFIEKWNKSIFFKYKYQKEIIYKINNKNFNLLFKLFDYKDPKFFDKDIGLLLCERFPDFIKNMNNIDIIKNISLFIYIFDQRYNDIDNFMEYTI